MDATPTTSAVPTTLTIRAWPDPVIEARGFAPTSTYVEWAWLPVIGPSTTWAFRRLATGLEAQPDGYDIDVAELAQSLGLGSGAGRSSGIFRAITRLVVFGLARWEDESTLAVLRKAPPLAGRQLRRLSPRLQHVHSSLLARKYSVQQAS